jgi:hypothetical protein
LVEGSFSAKLNQHGLSAFNEKKRKEKEKEMTIFMIIVLKASYPAISLTYVH